MIESNPVVPVYGEIASHEVRSEIATIIHSLKKKYETPYGALYAPYDIDTVQKIKALGDQLTKLNSHFFVLIGIGGSSLGTLAVANALRINTKDFLCADTIDDRDTSELLAQFRAKLAQGQRAILCMVTKSGTTAETIINSALFLEVLKEYHPDDYNKYIVVISDANSPLDVLARQESYHLLSIPQAVGGRYSVFTAAGLFPLMMLGVNIEQFCKGAHDALRSALDESIEINEAAQCALMLYAHYEKGYILHNLFVFSHSMRDLAQWYKQLIGESLGKELNRAGERVEVGFIPFVSQGTADLHSVAQVYLAGPRTLLTSFLLDATESNNLSIPSNQIASLLPGMEGSLVTTVKSAIIKGTIAAFKKQKRPTLVTHLSQTPEQIGAFMALKMVETILLGKLLNVNPFDQPAVELYKQETRIFLKN